MKFISEGLESKAKSSNSKLETITIDASAYSDQNQIWAYIYESVRKKFSSNVINRAKYVLTFHWKLFVVILAFSIFMHIVVPHIPEPHFFMIIYELLKNHYGAITKVSDAVAILGLAINFSPSFKLKQFLKDTLFQ